MTTSSMNLDRQRDIRELFDEYIEMYASRDERLTAHFSENFSGITGSDDFLVKGRDEWIEVTRRDFCQVPGRIRIEMLELSLQDISKDVAIATALFHIHLPVAEPLLSKEVARLVLVFHLEGDEWKIVHSSISIPYQMAQKGEVYPIRALQERNSALEALVNERTQELRQSETLFRLLTEDVQDVVWKADGNLRITYISPADEGFRGFKAAEVIGHHVFEMFNDAGVAVVKKIMQQRAEAEQSKLPTGVMSFEAEHRCKDGRLIWGEVHSKPDRNAKGDIVGYHGITREITKRKCLEDQVRQLAFHDQLTNLANRRLLIDHLTLAMSDSKRSGRFGCLLLLDLDNFKPLNDIYGHAVGDQMLIEVAKRLHACVRESDTVARFGGDEFVVLFKDLSADRDESNSQAGVLAEEIRMTLSAEYLLEGTQAVEPESVIKHQCTSSIGAAVFKGGEASHDEVIAWADEAMYQAKEDGRNLVVFHKVLPPR